MPDNHHLDQALGVCCECRGGTLDGSCRMVDAATMVIIPPGHALAFVAFLPSVLAPCHYSARKALRTDLAQSLAHWNLHQQAFSWRSQSRSSWACQVRPMRVYPHRHYLHLLSLRRSRCLGTPSVVQVGVVRTCIASGAACSIRKILSPVACNASFAICKHHTAGIDFYAFFLSRSQKMALCRYDYQYYRHREERCRMERKVAPAQIIESPVFAGIGHVLVFKSHEKSPSVLWTPKGQSTEFSKQLFQSDLTSCAILPLTLAFASRTLSSRNMMSWVLHHAQETIQ